MRQKKIRNGGNTIGSTIPLFIFFAKVLMMLVQNDKFKKESLMKNHLVIHLMIVLFLTQISKLVTFILVFHFVRLRTENYDCVKNLDGNFADNFWRCVHEKLVWGANTFGQQKDRQRYFATQICSLGEGFYIVIVMIFKKISCSKLCWIAEIVAQ